jgi:choline-sulfatase
VPKTPNILLFLTDDHAPWTLPCYGNSEVQAPTFDRLAREGAVFRNAFTPTPVCSPGRACLLTGLTCSQHGVHDWIAMHDPECQERDWLAGQVTLSELLQQNGYHCGLAGKWHIGQDYQTPRGYDWYFGFAIQGGHQGLSTYVYEDRVRLQRGNVTEIVTEQAIDFLNRAPDDKPFFLHVGFTDTHSPYVGQDPELVALYQNATFQDIDIDPQHPWHWNEGFAQDATIAPDDIRIRHMTQYAAVTDIDRHMEKLIATLESNGQLDNTLIIYTSDHGLSLGQNGFWGKGNATRPLNLYDISTRIPLIIRGPNISPGVKIDHCVDHFDTFQTLLDVCHLDGTLLRQDTPYPGKSYLSLAQGDQKPPWDDTRYGEYGDMRMIRTPEYKLVKRYPDGPDELFDLINDPRELINRIGKADLLTVQKELTQNLNAFFAQHEDPVKSGLRVRELPRHNTPQKPAQIYSSEAWRDGIRSQHGQTPQ